MPTSTEKNNNASGTNVGGFLGGLVGGGTVGAIVDQRSEGVVRPLGTDPVIDGGWIQL